MTQARELPQCIKATMQMESNMHERIHADGVRMHRTGVLLNVKPAQVDLLFVVPDVRLPALGPPACNLRACSSHACKHREGTQCHPADGIFSCVHGHVGKTATHNRPQIHARADLGMCWGRLHAHGMHERLAHCRTYACMHAAHADTCAA